MLVKCKDITNIIEKIAPLYLAEKYDNVGLLIGDENAYINSVLLSLDINSEVVEEAVKTNSNLIITHHPIIFSPLKSINIKHPNEKLVHSLISQNINVYSAHTNLDVCENGINNYLAEKLDLSDVSVIEKTYSEKYYKIAVYVPEGYEKKVWEAMVTNGAGNLGNYSCCTFKSEGQGTFKPLYGSEPFIGRQGITEYVNEIKIESIVNEKDVHKLIYSIIKVHPYEEPAYDLIPMINHEKIYGLGRTGYLKNPVSLLDLCSKVKNVLNVDNLRIIGDLNKTVKKIAVCGGSGGSLLENVYASSCDVYITGDIKYHDACDARERGISIIDAGHFATENLYMEYLYNFIKSEIQREKLDITLNLSKSNKNPYKIV